MSGFKYKVAFGCWLNDMRNLPLPGEAWPCIILDDQAEKDTIECLELQSKAGFNFADIAGLIVAYSWPEDISSIVSDDRRVRINRILDAAHGFGLKILTYPGVFSWGFDDIIKNHPEVSGTSQSAMCASKKESWEWQFKVIDYVLDEFPKLDGLHIESADRGRCRCDVCSEKEDIDYYCSIDARIADHIKTKYPDKTVFVSTCGYKPWKDENEARHLVELSKHIDFLISPNWWFDGCYFDNDIRKKYIADLKCAFGSSGGTWVYVPQRWDRLKWFLPYARRTGENIRQLFREGGNALEYYVGPVINPGVEANIAFGGHMLSEPERPVEDVLFDTLHELYMPQDDRTCRRIVDIFLLAEDSYFKYYDALFPGGAKRICELRLTHLWGNQPGPVTYLSTYNEDFHLKIMNRQERSEYKEILKSILDSIKDIEKHIASKDRLIRIKICISNVIADLDDLNSNC